MNIARRSLAALLAAPFVAHAQGLERLRLVLNFHPDGGTAAFFLAKERGYYREAGIDLTLDGSSGSGDAITRVASGAYQVGVGDMATLAQFLVRNPDTAPRAVMPLHDSSPQAVVSLARSGIGKPSDLVGHVIGQGPSDGASRMFPAFCRLNGVDISKVNLRQVTSQLRDSLLLTQQVDGVTGYDYTVFFNLKANGTKPEDIRIMRYGDHGMDFYGNAILASQSMIAERPDVLRRFLAASARGWRETLADPAAGAAIIKKEVPLLDEAIETERITFLRDNLIWTPRTRLEGIGTMDLARLREGLAVVKEGFGLPRAPTEAEIFDGRFLPPIAERRVG
ncbi:NitT/TauT family transport system substrate-binding protein [Humitalea rosea]|uniref:Thiamine pyrimidine synthase n=1 Tax=Humitalea rosea TaxID=990373 RepID=A0A2W7I277_9PROT|nr:ABC transporter substrate-binding protein [Humitalea rosea]PZW40844.1 NitT/TauT family transport system substrate-binding protein [Humitalea rosea]